VNCDVQSFALAARNLAPAEAKEQTYIVALLSQMGRLALASIDPIAPATASARQVTRRLARRWNLPHWHRNTLDLLEHSPEVVNALHGDFAVIQAIHGAEAQIQEPVQTIGRSNPYQEPLLPDLLATAEKLYRRDAAAEVRRLESELDRVFEAFRDHVAGEAARLQDRKLTAMAELAAGAGHEINTPLAIISGQSQYLLATEGDPERSKSLQTIVQQAHRVHEILTDLRQFARPAVPQIRVIDLSILSRDVADSLAARAQAKDVYLSVDVNAGHIASADARQFRSALHGLIRNAIEAAPSGGHVAIYGEVTADRSRIVVEDNGPGVEPAIVDYIFDPFFSGRSAGRGRGLGLSTAWRLAKQQGGDVRYERTADGLTRFIFSLPRAEASSDRLSA
jgi:signal transduction histidine kinase